MFPDWLPPNPRPPAWWAGRLDAVHSLDPLPAALAARPCLGVSRFYHTGEECPDRVLTCFWGRSGVRVEAVRAWSGWGSPGPRQLPPVDRWSAWVPRHLLPPRLRGWDRVAQSFMDAPSCDRTAGLGGLGCLHAFASAGGAGCVEWSWPDPRRDREPWRCIWAYRWLWVVGRALSWRRPGGLRDGGRRR